MNRHLASHMNITILKQVDNKFYIGIGRDNGDRVNVFGFDMTLEELKMLEEKISQELKKEEEEKPEVVWNPRSRRHEIKRK